MNKERRKKINNIIDKIRKENDNLNNVLSDEEIAFDSMPEGLQSSERGIDSEEAIEIMQNSIETINEVLNDLEEIIY